MEQDQSRRNHEVCYEDNNDAAALARDPAFKIMTGKAPKSVGNWMNLQKLYELRLAEQKSGEMIKDLPTLPKTNEGTER